MHRLSVRAEIHATLLDKAFLTMQMSEISSDSEAMAVSSCRF